MVRQEEISPGENERKESRRCITGGPEWLNRLLGTWQPRDAIGIEAERTGKGSGEKKEAKVKKAI